MSFRNLYDAALKVIVPTFGDESRYYPKNKKRGPYTFTAIFDEKYLAVDPNTEELISGNEPRIGVDLSKMKSVPEKGDECVVLDKRWRVKDTVEDGLGASTLLLTRIESR